MLKNDWKECIFYTFSNLISNLIFQTIFKPSFLNIYMKKSVKNKPFKKRFPKDKKTVKSKLSKKLKTLKKLTQQQVWDKIAGAWTDSWSENSQKSPDYVVNFLKKKKGNIVDIGCGEGRNFIKVDGTIYGIDFSEKQLEYAKKNAKKKDIKVILVKASAEKPPFVENFFDAAICIATLHCLESENTRKKAIEEMHRVLKKGAEAMVVVWNKDSDRFKNKEKQVYIGTEVKGKRYERYYYLYDKYELRHLLKSAGFKIVKETKDKMNLIFVVKK